MKSILVRANGNIYTAVVYEDGRCVLDTGEEFMLSTDQLEVLADMSERTDRIAVLAEKGREILPITDQKQMEAPEEDLTEPEEALPEAEQSKDKKTVAIGKPNKEALGIEDLEEYEKRLEAVRRKREDTAKLLSLILVILLVLSGLFLILLSSGTLDPVLKQAFVQTQEVVNNGL